MKFLVTGGTGNVAPEGGGASPAREDQATPPISRIGYFVPDERPGEILRHVLAMTKSWPRNEAAQINGASCRTRIQ